jgi:hypothetical protein
MMAPPRRPASPYTRRFLDVVEQLWPDAQVSTEPGLAARDDGQDEDRADNRANDSSESHALLVPGLGHPRMLLPDSRLLAPDAVRGFGGATAGRRLRGRVASALLAHGRGQLRGTRVTIRQPLPSESIESHLAEILGRHVRVAMRLGPLRANSKPVLQVLDPGGHTVGFAKIGNTALTRELVCAEANTLHLLDDATLHHVVAPKVLHHGQWQGLEVLLQSALQQHTLRRPSQATVLCAMREVSLCGEVRAEPLAYSSYLHRLQDRLLKLPYNDDSAMLHQALGALAQACTESRWWFGSWHGDWTVWNTRADHGRLQVWDWERYEPLVPCGFDTIHQHVQSLLAGSSQRSRAAQRTLADAERLLRPWDQPGGQARAIVTAYLVDIGARYLADDQAGAGNEAGRLESWLLPALARETKRLNGRYHKRERHQR